MCFERASTFLNERFRVSNSIHFIINTCKICIIVTELPCLGTKSFKLLIFNGTNYYICYILTLELKEQKLISYSYLKS